MKTMLNRGIALAVLAMFAQPALAVYPTGTGNTYVTTVDAATYGSTGSITFHDWNYVGPNGSSVNDFQVRNTAGFDASQIGQKQKVVTTGPDWLTPDPGKAVQTESLSSTFLNANMDSTVNFYKWGYTTVAGSTFNNMQIDKNGNYFIGRNDMNFKFYDLFAYNNKQTAATPDLNSPVSSGSVSAGFVTTDMTVDTGINFQPYAISDAKGWCGSVLKSNPNGLEKMAGQVTFDFAFDAYLNDGAASTSGGGTQIVPGFVMRSYGDYVMSVTVGADTLTFKGNAVINNTNPTNGNIDPTFQNLVSFLGGGVIPKGVWVTADSYNTDGTKKLNADGTWQVNVAYSDTYGSVTCNPATVTGPRGDGAKCFQNSYAGYPFLMRADGSRQLYYINPNGHSNYTTTDPLAYASIASIPVPAAAWLLGSGLVALAGSVRRKTRF